MGAGVPREQAQRGVGADGKDRNTVTEKPGQLMAGC